MQFVWPIKAEYLIVYLDEDYSKTVIGRSKRDFVALELGSDTLQLMRQVKGVFDPDGILNPGKSLPDSAD